MKGPGFTTNQGVLRPAETAQGPTAVARPPFPNYDKELQRASHPTCPPRIRAASQLEQQSRMQAKLVIVGGKANKREISLELPSTIGRSREADLTVAHPMISRQHCELFEVDGQVMIRDLDSLNGTFVGQEQVKEAALRPHDRFSIGSLTFRVEYDYLGETPVAPSGGPAGQTGQSEVESAAGTPVSKPVGPETPAEEPVAVVGIEETLAVDQAPVLSPVEDAGQPAKEPGGIAPADGELPDFTAWAAADSGWGGPLAPPPAEVPVAAEQQPEAEAEIDEDEEPEPEPTPPPIREKTPVEKEPLPEVVEIEEVEAVEDIGEVKEAESVEEIKAIEDIVEIEEVEDIEEVEEAEEPEEPEPTPSPALPRPAPVKPEASAQAKQTRTEPPEEAELIEPAEAEEPVVELEPVELEPVEPGETPIAPEPPKPAVSSDDDDLNEFLKGLQ